MKKILVVLLVMVVGLTGLYANGRGEFTSIEGKLAVHESVPVVETADGLWVLPAAPFYRIAWENGLSIGDSLVIRGFTNSDDCLSSEKFAGQIMPVEVQVNGKDLDITDATQGERRGIGPAKHGRKDEEFRNNGSFHDRDKAPKRRRSH